MKKAILPIAILGLALMSCKKDYSCTCTYTETSMGTTDTDVDVFTISGATKNEAAAACNEATIEQVETGYSFKRSCSLSK